MVITSSCGWGSTFPKTGARLIDKAERPPKSVLALFFLAFFLAIKLGVAICHVYSIKGLQSTARRPARARLLRAVLGSIIFFSIFPAFLADTASADWLGWEGIKLGEGQRGSGRDRRQLEEESRPT
jgi:hypothetical protein